MTLTQLVTHPEAAAETTALARSLTALHVSHGRVWAGYGDTFNNTGPCTVRGFDPAAGAWDQALSYATDRAGRFRNIGSELWVSMDDPQASQDWGFGRVAGTTPAQVPLTGEVRNLLTANQSSFEEGNLTGWSPADTTVNRAWSTAQAFHGVASMAISRASSTAGTTNAFTPLGAEGIPLDPNSLYEARGFIWTPSTRTYQINLVFYDAAGVFFGTAAGKSASFASGWGKFSTVFTVPVGAAFAAVEPKCTTSIASTDAAWHVDAISFNQWSYGRFTLGGTKAPATLFPVHTYDYCVRVPGEIYAVGSWTATFDAGLARSFDNGATWEPLIYRVTADRYGRFYNVGALNGVVYTVLGGATGAQSTEQYVLDLGEPCHTWNGTDAGRGPVLNGFIHPQNFGGRLVYRGQDDVLRSFNGQSVADHRAAKLHAVGAGLCWVVDGSTLYSSPDLSTWTDRGAAPAGATSLAVAA